VTILSEIGVSIPSKGVIPCFFQQKSLLKCDFQFRLKRAIMKLHQGAK